MASRHSRRSSLDFDVSRKIRKSVSCEPLGDFSSSEDEDRGGGARLTTYSLTPSPAGKKSSYLKKSASETGGSPQSNANSFRIGANHDDDVFAGDSLAPGGFGRASTLTNRPKNLVLRNPDFEKQLATAVSPVSIDAQGIYPPTACIFAANLFQGADDESLELEVTRVFSQFGPVFVKIRRDGRGLPFAFCQFTCDDHAVKAKNEGKGALILGRPCRTEMARAHSSFIVFKSSREPILASEATRLLGQLGEIARVEPLDEEVQRALRLPPAMLISYKMYDPRRDVVHTFRSNREYRILPYDPKSVPTHKREYPPRHTIQGRQFKPELLAEYDRDRRSAYVGNLPLSMTEDRLASIVNTCGTVAGIGLIRKPVEGMQGRMTCFAFVEYMRPDSADDLVHNLNNMEIDGHPVRVARKESRSFRSPHKFETVRPKYNTVQGSFPRRSRGRMGFRAPHVKDIFYQGPTNAEETPSSSLGDAVTSDEQNSEQQLIESKHAHSAPQVATPMGKGSGPRSYDTPRRPMAHDAPMSPPFTMPHFSSPYPATPWVSPYGPYPFGPVSPYGAMPPGGSPGMLYGGMFPSPVYPSMYPDMFGVMSPNAVGMHTSSGGEDVSNASNTPTRAAPHASVEIQDHQHDDQNSGDDGDDDTSEVSH